MNDCCLVAAQTGGVMKAGDWIHTRAFAALLGPGVSERTVREMCKRGQLACVPLGCPGSKRPRWFVHKDAMDTFLPQTAPPDGGGR